MDNRTDLSMAIERARAHEIRADAAEQQIRALTTTGDALVGALREGKPVRERVLSLCHQWDSLRGHTG